ncbi:GAF domain-containing protein [Jannaschia sp. LMIT008]|uniref:GAF domain-containing protein n=1 Tax=Jannaschia maritima TaxID=3032585 RepID=UPI0028117697|nr:GAF domain-containing protein [Jannaschia sp. LMIT008]
MIHDSPMTARMRHIANVAKLKSLSLLDTEAEDCFDEVVAVACSLFDVPTALVSLLDMDRQWFKARQGLDAAETPLDISFCQFAVRTRDVMVVLDATKDERFVDNPLVTGDPHIRFYAGAPLTVGGGFRIGTLCLIDRTARSAFPLADRNLLRGLGIIVSELIEGRAARMQLDAD